MTVQTNIFGDKVTESKEDSEPEIVGESAGANIGRCCYCGIPGNGHRDTFVFYGDAVDKIYCERCLKDHGFVIKGKEVFSEQ